jgi:hypothetical protein
MTLFTEGILSVLFFPGNPAGQAIRLLSRPELGTFGYPIQIRGKANVSQPMKPSLGRCLFWTSMPSARNSEIRGNRHAISFANGNNGPAGPSHRNQRPGAARRRFAGGAAYPDPRIASKSAPRSCPKGPRSRSSSSCQRRNSRTACPSSNFWNRCRLGLAPSQPGMSTTSTCRKRKMRGSAKRSV